MSSNVKAVRGGVPALQRILDQAFQMGAYAKRNKRRGSVNRRAVWPMGRQILNVRWMTKKELQAEGWLGRGGCIAIDLNDGGILYASADSEGNGPGALFAKSPRGEFVTVLAKN